LMAAYAYVVGGDHDFSDPTKPVLDQTRTSAGVSIGRGAWIGAGAKLLDGITIGERAVVGAGAVVRESVPAFAIAVGVPARIVQTTRDA
jgi:acetyltransferase-like isoleucine patch superfamily enzyme